MEYTHANIRYLFWGIKKKTFLKFKTSFTNLHYLYHQSKQNYLTLQRDLFSNYCINACMVTDYRVNVFKQDCMPGLM